MRAWLILCRPNWRSPRPTRTRGDPVHRISSACMTSSCRWMSCYQVLSLSCVVLLKKAKVLGVQPDVCVITVAWCASFVFVLFFVFFPPTTSSNYPESGRALHPAGSGGWPHLPKGGVPEDPGLQGLQVSVFVPGFQHVLHQTMQLKFKQCNKCRIYNRKYTCVLMWKVSLSFVPFHISMKASAVHETTCC